MQLEVNCITDAQMRMLARRLERRAALLLSEVERDAAELRDIDDALARVNAGTFGLCVECAAPLPLARLDAAPLARRCASCEAACQYRPAAPKL